MNQETIRAIKEAHPETFATKRAAGLTEEQAAEVIVAQIEHDKTNPPAAAALAKARSITDIYKARLANLKHIHKELMSCFEDAKKLNPEIPAEELPEVPEVPTCESDTDEVDQLRKQNADLNALLDDLKQEGEKLLNIEAFNKELREALAKREQDVISLGEELASQKTRVTELESRILELKQPAPSSGKKK